MLNLSSHEKLAKHSSFDQARMGQITVRGHSLQKHVNPTLSLETNVLARRTIYHPSYQRLPSTWISPARKKKRKSGIVG